MIDIIKLVRYMESKSYIVSKGENETNIVYLEGMDYDGQLNNDALNGWNDLRLIFSYKGGIPSLDFIQVATTEPGLKPTNNPTNKNGVARIAFGQYTAWKHGFHKGNKNHPCLKQCNVVSVCRDFNKDGKRTGDKIYVGLFGINQHSTKDGYDGSRVEDFSEGCLVGRNWQLHLKFLELTKSDPRYIKDKEFVYTSTILDASEFAKYL